ncbi:hypothetical protein V8C35DRAFT_297077 [Trichoderma chlorosporum]
MFFFFPLSLLEWRLHGATNLGWNDGIHEIVPVWRFGRGILSIIQREFLPGIEFVLRLALRSWLSLSTARGKQLELGIIRETGTGGREGTDGNHAASRGGLSNIV